MPDLPPPLLGLIGLVIAALALLGWKMHQVLNGRQARMRRRLAAITGNAAIGEEGRGGRFGKRRSVQDRLKAVEGHRAQTRGYRLREQLRLAGLKIDLSRYLMVCFALALIAMAVAKLVGLGWMAALMAALILGVGLPKLSIGILAKRRSNRFVGQFADGIDIIVRGIRTGLPLGECINIVAREMPDPLGGEFRLIIEAQKIGVPLSDALQRAVQRMPINDFRYFAIVIAIQQQTGGNLAETLAKLSEVLRSRKRMRDKILAYASEARTSAYIIGSMPVVVILALGVFSPKYVGLLFNTDFGNFLLVVGALTEVCGLWIMNKMISFDI